MTPPDAQLVLSDQRLRELMLWHGEDEASLPPPATLAHLSRDTVAAVQELARVRAQLSRLRAALSCVFWNCDSSAVRRSVLDALGAPPPAQGSPHTSPEVAWAAAHNGLPPPRATEEPRVPALHRHAAG